MPARFTARLSYANVVSTLALFFALSTGVVYAADEWTGDNIVNGSITGLDIAPDSLGTNKIKDENIGAIDLAFDSVGMSEIMTDGVGASEISDNAIDGGELIDGSIGAADLGPSSVGSSEIASSAVGSSEIASSAVGSAEIASSAVGASEIADGSVTVNELKGAAINGVLQLDAGAVPNGRCEHFDIAVGGATAGEAVVVSLKADIPDGMILYGVRVRAANTVVMAICNFTGGGAPGLDAFPIRVITFG